jgi:hypothetical protein
MICSHPLLATSAETLLGKCSVFVDTRDFSKLSEKDKSAIDWCDGYIQAVIDPLRDHVRIVNSGQPTQYYASDGVCQYTAGVAFWDDQHAIYILVKYLRDYPTKQKLSAYVAITEALRKEYPCH